MDELLPEGLSTCFHGFFSIFVFDIPLSRPWLVVLIIDT